jgi:hypothetical protein
MPQLVLREEALVQTNARRAAVPLEQEPGTYCTAYECPKQAFGQPTHSPEAAAVRGAHHLEPQLLDAAGRALGLVLISGREMTWWELQA